MLRLWSGKIFTESNIEDEATKFSFCMGRYALKICGVEKESPSRIRQLQSMIVGSVQRVSLAERKMCFRLHNAQLKGR